MFLLLSMLYVRTIEARLLRAELLLLAQNFLISWVYFLFESRVLVNIEILTWSWRCMLFYPIRISASPSFIIIGVIQIWFLNGSVFSWPSSVKWLMSLSNLCQWRNFRHLLLDMNRREWTWRKSTLIQESLLAHHFLGSVLNFLHFMFQKNVHVIVW